MPPPPHSYCAHGHEVAMLWLQLNHDRYPSLATNKIKVSDLKCVCSDTTRSFGVGRPSVGA